MKSSRDIDFTQQPASYWIEDDLLKTILRNVQGTQRRKMIMDYWKAGRIEELDAELLEDVLNEDARVRLGLIHPAFMGGEYLPGYQPDEVEIARIELASTTHDVVSIRARREADGICYSVVDEYGTEFTFEPKQSREPLSLAEVAQLIEGLEGGDDGEPFVWCVLSGTGDGGTELDPEFVTIRSDFYADLQSWWGQRLEQWIAERKLAGKRP
jgi:hypothetical protein